MSIPVELNYAKSILNGMAICGMRFGPCFAVLLEPLTGSRTGEYADGTSNLLLSARWKLVTSEEFVRSRNLVCADLSAQEQFSLLYSCAEETIVDVAIDRSKPTLILHLSNSKVIVIDGFDEDYESWSFSFRSFDGSRYVKVFATPGGDLSIIDEGRF